MRWKLAQALAAAARDIDPEMCRVVDAAGLDLGWFVAGETTSLVDWGMWDVWGPQPLGLEERRRAVKVELLRRVRFGPWKLIWLPDSPLKAEPFPDSQVAELVPENLDIEKSEVILGERRYRVRVEVEKRRRPTVDLVKGRVEEALAQGHISWEVFDGMTEEAMRSRFHSESRTARNVVRAVRAALRAKRKSVSPAGREGLD